MDTVQTVSERTGTHRVRRKPVRRTVSSEHPWTQFRPSASAQGHTERSGPGIPRRSQAAAGRRDRIPLITPAKQQVRRTAPQAWADLHFPDLPFPAQPLQTGDS